MIQLQQDFEHQSTSVPNLFIDEYMTEANGEFVKVYLYLLRCMSGHATECSVCSIADHCGHTENDVLRALRYWERVGLLRLTCDSDGQIASIQLCNLYHNGISEGSGTSARAIHEVSPSTQNAVGFPITPMAGDTSPIRKDDTIRNGMNDSMQIEGEDSVTGMATIASTTSAANSSHSHNITAFRMKPASSPKEYTPDEVDAFRKDPNVCELFYVIEMYLKHPLSSTDTNTILYWYDELHFATDLICYLVEYCISKGHSNLRYMDKVAMGWKDAGIATIEQAKEQAATHSKAYYAVMKAFGINGRSLTEEETASVTRWTKEYGFDLPIVQEACRRTMSAIHQPSFEYAEAILKDWQKNHVHTIEDIQALDTAYAKAKKHSAPSKDANRRSNKFSNFNQREYNYEQLEQYLLNTTV